MPEITSYTYGIHETDKRDIIISKTLDIINKKLTKKVINSVAFRGMSGALIAPIIAYELGVNTINVRKDKLEGSHCGTDVEGFSSLSAGNYIIIDDFIGTGATMKTIIAEVKKFCPKFKCVGIILYQSYGTSKHHNKIPVFHSKSYQ